MEAPVSNDKKEPCGNEDCDLCYPMPRFKIATPRIVRRVHEREIKAATAEEALRIYNEGTAWPSSYDEHDEKLVEQFGSTVTQLDRRPEDQRGWLCWHNLPKDEG
jgi:hypothetical protein